MLRFLVNAYCITLKTTQNEIFPKTETKFSATRSPPPHHEWAKTPSTTALSFQTEKYGINKIEIEITRREKGGDGEHNWK
jgi:hypothetical protein